MGEVKRVFHKKMWILIAVAVLGNLCLFLYSELDINLKKAILTHASITSSSALKE